jgi:5-methylcytosine-specific restriction endonuclease McrA
MKLRAVKYKGGKCASCGYNKTLSALEFHHKDPKQKDFAISRRMNGATEATFELLKKELDKCNLLCSNCHREAHERERNGKNRRLNHN